MKTIYKKLLFLLLFLPLGVLAQGTLNGTVLDKVSKLPLPGVNVVVQGSTNGASTDFDGKYKLSNVKKGDKIVFSYIGYKDSVVTYDGGAQLTVNLNEDISALQEVVVIGYGTAKKKDATGSVSLITAKDFNKGAILSADQLLAGKAAGVRITNAGGSPDSAPNIRIRGGASLSASNNPLIIIDGVPIGDLNPAGVSNPFTLINPNDIESFSILKDASATAIYGVRASNGVIIITTKKGSTGAPQFNFSSNVSVGYVTKRLDVQDGVEFTRFIQTYHPNFTNLLGIDDPTTTTVDDPNTPQIEGRIVYDTDWQKTILRTAFTSDNYFSARANLYKSIPFRASIGYTKSEGLVKTSDYQRFSYSFKLTPKLLHDDLKVDINAKGTYSDKNAIDEGASLGGALSMDPTKPVYDVTGENRFGGYYQSHKIIAGTKPQDQLQGAYNPLAMLEQRSRPERVLRFLGNAEFEYKLPFLRDLRAILNLGLDASESRIREVFAENALQTYTFSSGTDPATNYLFNPGVSYLENQTSTNKTMDAYLAYNKNLTGFFTRVDAQAGYSYQNFVTDGNKVEFENNATTGIRQVKVDLQFPNRRYYLPLNLQAYFARANFDIMNKYLFTATFRADASSLFQEDKRWGYFPAVGAAWKLKEESFLKNSNVIRDLKLRAGWGKTGQANIANVDGVGYFPSRPLFTIGSSNGQYLPGLNTYTAKAFDADITWEKTTTINLGLDFEIGKTGIFGGSFDYYQRKTNDLLSVVPNAPGQNTSGTEFIKNVGSIEGNGFELNLNLKAIATDNFGVNLSGNIAYNYNTVSDLKGNVFVQDHNSGLVGTGVFLANNAVGEQPYSAWVYQQIYDANGQPVVGAYADVNNDGIINDKDKHYVALRPNWTYGFSTSVTYKNFDLTANFRGQIGGQIYKFKTLSNGSVSGSVSQSGNSLNNTLNFYDGTASALFNDYNGKATFSDYLLEDASFLRCDNIALSYKVGNFTKGSSLRLTGSVNNVFIVTKYSGQDPESFESIDRNFYPRPVTYTFGLSLDF